MPVVVINGDPPRSVRPLLSALGQVLVGEVPVYKVPPRSWESKTERGNRGRGGVRLWVRVLRRRWLFVFSRVGTLLLPTRATLSLS